MWYKNKMFKKNKFMLDKCSIRVYYCGIRTKHNTTTQEGNKMNFYDILMVINNNASIRTTVTMFGMKFKTEHRADYFLGCETDELLDKRVADMKVTEKNVLEIILENK